MGFALWYSVNHRDAKATQSFCKDDSGVREPRMAAAWKRD
jgi:hypothetical protein